MECTANSNCPPFYAQLSASESGLQSFLQLNSHYLRIQPRPSIAANFVLSPHSRTIVESIILGIIFRYPRELVLCQLPPPAPPPPQPQSGLKFTHLLSSFALLILACWLADWLVGWLLTAVVGCFGVFVFEFTDRPGLIRVGVLARTCPPVYRIAGPTTPSARTPAPRRPFLGQDKQRIDIKY